MTARDVTVNPESYRIRERTALSEETNMSDFPIWLKLIIWGTMGLTVLYTLWGMFHSVVQS